MSYEQLSKKHILSNFLSGHIFSRFFSFSELYYLVLISPHFRAIPFLVAYNVLITARNFWNLSKKYNYLLVLTSWNILKGLTVILVNKQKKIFSMKQDQKHFLQDRESSKLNQSNLPINQTEFLLLPSKF